MLRGAPDILVEYCRQRFFQAVPLASAPDLRKPSHSRRQAGRCNRLPLKGNLNALSSSQLVRPQIRSLIPAKGVPLIE